MDKGKTIDGIVISRKDIGEADRLLTVFSKSEGKIKVVARGARRIKSKNASHVEPFTVGKYSIVPGKTFYVLTGAQSQTVNSKISENLDKYNKATYLCELLDIIGVEGQKMPRTYKRFTESIGKINEGKNVELDILLCEFVLLSEMGYGGDYQKCFSCGAELQECDFYWGSLEGVACTNCQPKKIKISKSLLKILRLMQKGQFDRIYSIKNNNEYIPELKNIITVYLYETLPRVPRTGRL